MTDSEIAAELRNHGAVVNESLNNLTNAELAIVAAEALEARAAMQRKEG